MDTEKAEKSPSSRLVGEIQLAGLVYLVPLAGFLVGTEVFGVWPGHGWLFNENTSQLMLWSQLSLLYSTVGAILFVPLLLTAMAKKTRIYVSTVLLVLFLAAPVATWEFRFYDALGTGV